MTVQTDKKLYTISEAAQVLGVSIDTIRRWEKAGKLTAMRGANGIRLFYAEDINALPKTADDTTLLSVSQAATYLGISPATLRRWDREGKLTPQRSLGNERVYTKAAVDSFVADMANAKLAPIAYTGPVGYLKDKATVFSDTITLALFDASIFQRYKQNIIVGSLILVSLLAIATSYTKRSTALDITQLTPEQLNTLAANLSKTPTNAETTTSNGILVRVTNPAPQVQLESVDTSVIPPTPPTYSVPGSYSDGKILAELKNIPSVRTNAATTLLVKQASSPENGTGVLPAGKQSIMIPAASLTSNSRVLVTPTSSVSSALYVSQKVAGQGFVVTLSTPEKKPVSFDWLIIN